MKFRLGVILGAGVGYYFGAKAGRERYEQMRRVTGALRRVRPVAKVNAFVEIGRERFRPDPEVIETEPFVPVADDSTSRN